MIKLVANGRETETNNYNARKPRNKYTTSKRPGSGGTNNQCLFLEDGEDRGRRSMVVRQSESDCRRAIKY